MCGINGFTWNDADALRRMHAATKHRGPDDEGFFEAPGISFAHNRLSIIDLSPGGHQPMTTPDPAGNASGAGGRFTVVFNGEIYNYRELRRELEALGESFTSQSDTEVLVRAFARWGIDGLKKLNGIFAFAVWDRDERSLTLVRDQVGVKPLYYYFDGKRLAFSSEIKALLEHGIPRVIDREALNAYFRLLYVPGPRTMFREVKKLEPGHALVFKDGQVTIRQWWKLEEGNPIASYNDAVHGVRDRVRAAVERQLVSDRPLGVFLSGGIDSTSVLAMMRELDPKGVIKTFSVGYERTDEAEKYNMDARLARQTSAHFGTEHHEFTMTADHVLHSLETIIAQMDEPVSNHVQSSTYLLAQFAKPTITVALGGDGGDELFGGYPRYWYSRMIDVVRQVPLARQSLGLVMGGEFARKAAAMPGLERHLSFVMQKEELVRSFLKTGDGAAVRSALSPVFEAAWHDATNQLMAADVQTWLPDESLVRTDKLTMAHGLEERVPLLDADLVEYAFRIPSRFKLGSRSQGKRVFIDAMRPYLPPHVLDQEKRAWMSPAAKWIRGPMLPFVREVLSPGFVEGTSDLIDFEAAN
ncbi:MAG TPA: asparagine synthase (glutamine-hydrolyzing), partial [Candidatus Methylomirabilis sp.]|nr:asparagine synthase (glutamine-hydrolyzing) [Candidatus Methylomirabilis sp.]